MNHSLKVKLHNRGPVANCWTQLGARASDVRRRDLGPTPKPTTGRHLYQKPKTRAAAQNGIGDKGTAYDIAVTSTLTPSVLSASPSPRASLEQPNKYADTERAHCNTEEQCRAVGVTFQPLGFDSQGGGWDDATQHLLAKAVKGIEARGLSQDSVGGKSVSSVVTQRISSSLQR